MAPKWRDQGGSRSRGQVTNFRKTFTGEGQKMLTSQGDGSLCITGG